MNISAEDIAVSTGATLTRAQTFAPIINEAAPDFDINTPARMSAFLAQVGHESGGLHWLVELWGPSPAQERYEGRADLGNTQPGDGRLYCGRGLIQITGRANYQFVSDELGIDFVSAPGQLSLPENAVRSAMLFWRRHGLNELADAGDFERITRRINGGLNGEADRLALYSKAQEAITA